jgi:hypothetical protein
VDAAAPPVIVQSIPGTSEVTRPLPSAPDVTSRVWLSGGGEKVTFTVREKSRVTSHASGSSVAPVHPDQVMRVPVPDGVALSVTTVPVLKRCEHFPFSAAPEPGMVQPIPPRLEATVPPTVLPPSTTSRVTFVAELRAPSRVGAVGVGGGLSRQPVAAIRIASDRVAKVGGDTYRVIVPSCHACVANRMPEQSETRRRRSGVVHGGPHLNCGR